MHVCKNVVESLLRTFTNTKGTKENMMSVRLELSNQNKLPEYQVQENGKYARAFYIWTRAEMKSVFDWIASIQTPTWFVSNLLNWVKDMKLTCMKSHDYHILLQFIFPIIVKGTLIKELREGIYRLASLLRWLCGKSTVKA